LFNLRSKQEVINIAPQDNTPLSRVRPESLYILFWKRAENSNREGLKIVRIKAESRFEISNLRCQICYLKFLIFLYPDNLQSFPVISFFPSSSITTLPSTVLSFAAKDVECRLPKLKPASPFDLPELCLPGLRQGSLPLAKLSLRYLILRGLSLSEVAFAFLI
jgi:hypothetical protein